MPTVDIAQQTAAVGTALVSIPLHKIILELAKGIAWGQYELDKVGVDITKMMGVPGAVDIDGKKMSMLEAGFVPSFYHFVDTILELKMEVKIREEESKHMSYKDATSQQITTDAGVELGAKAKAGIGFASIEGSVKAHYNVKSTSAYSRSLDAGFSQQFSQELNASSLMRTKLVPKPAPELLVERIRILLEKLRKEAEKEAQANPQEGKTIDQVMDELLMAKIESRLLDTPDVVEEEDGGDEDGGDEDGGDEDGGDDDGGDEGGTPPGDGDTGGGDTGSGT